MGSDGLVWWLWLGVNCAGAMTNRHIGVCWFDVDRTVCRLDLFLLSFFYLQFGPVGVFEWTLLHSLWQFEFTEGSEHVQIF